jgi:hypothetical protein
VRSSERMAQQSVEIVDCVKQPSAHVDFERREVLCGFGFVMEAVIYRTSGCEADEMPDTCREARISGIPGQVKQDLLPRVGLRSE